MRGGALIRWTALDLARASKVGVATVRILRRAAMRLRQLDAATRIEDLRLPPPNRLDMKKSGLVAIHPGEFLAEILAELSISRAQFARSIGVSAMRISHVVSGARPVTAELALLFGKALGQSPQYWLNLQSGYDLATARKTVRRQFRRSNRWHHPVETSAMMLSHQGLHPAGHVPTLGIASRTVPPQGDFVL